jgi:hypothetical protein
VRSEGNRRYLLALIIQQAGVAHGRSSTTFQAVVMGRLRSGSDATARVENEEGYSNEHVESHVVGGPQPQFCKGLRQRDASATACLFKPQPGGTRHEVANQPTAAGAAHRPWRGPGVIKTEEKS